MPATKSSWHQFQISIAIEFIRLRNSFCRGLSREKKSPKVRGERRPSLGIFSKIFGEYSVRINFIISKSWSIKYVLGLFTCIAVFDIDGYAVYFGQENSQTVLGWTAHKVRQRFALHIHSFLLNGLKSIRNYNMELKICTVEGINKNSYNNQFY